MSASAGPISEFPTCGYLTIWLNAFLTKTESLERVHDALALKLSTIEIGNSRRATNHKLINRIVLVKHIGT